MILLYEDMEKSAFFLEMKNIKDFNLIYYASESIIRLYLHDYPSFMIQKQLTWLIHTTDALNLSAIILANTDYLVNANLKTTCWV